MLSSLTAAVLAGGLGTRLRSAVADRPKVLAEVAGRPFLAYLLDQLVDAGVRRAVLCTGYLGEMIEDAFGATYGPLALSYSLETEPLGTGGALRNALPLLGSETVLVLNGDSYCHADWRALARRHFAERPAATMLLTHVADTARYGRVELDAHDRILSFREKGGEADPGWINAGIYLIKRGVLESIRPREFVSLEREVFPDWLEAGVLGVRSADEFIDIGTSESYARAANALARQLTAV